MDSHAFASLAHLRILLVPVGSIHQSTFDKFASEIRAFDDIRLGDIPADQKGKRERFMPKPMSNGYLHLSFPSHPPPISHASLALFRPSHFPLGVIGVGVCSQKDSLSSLLDQFNTSIAEIFPIGSLYPLGKNCFIFEDSDDNPNLNLGDSPPGLVVIPGMMGNKKLYVGTLLADLCSHILGEFSRLVEVLESPQGNEYLNGSLFPTMPALSDMPMQLGNYSRSSSPQPDPRRTSFQRSSSGFNSPAASATSFRQSTLGLPANRNKRNSAIGAVSSPGRLYKVWADFFLLAGRIEDATIWYTEAIVMFKLPQDAPWYASALEGLATIGVLEAWLAGHGLADSFSNLKVPWFDISEKMAQAVSLYYRTPPPSTDIEQNHFFLSYLYTTSALRHATLLFSIWSAKGWGPLAFTTMLQQGASPYLPPTLSHPEHNTYHNLERLTSVTGISRSVIAAILAQAHGPWLLHLGPRERLAALETMAGIYACLGYKRKEVYILREVLGCVMDLLVCGREDFRGSAAKAGSSTNTGLGIRGVNIGGGSGGAVAMRHNDSEEGNQSILGILKYVCRVLGIDLEAVKLLVPNAEGEDGNDKVQSTESVLIDDEITEEVYGWPELQVGVIREAIAVAESLPDYPTVAQIALSALKTMYPTLASGDQYHLYSTSNRALTTASRRGDTRQIEYWAGKPIASIAVSPLPFIRLPIEKLTSMLTTKISGVNTVLTGAKDPFLYNPRKSAAVQEKLLAVQNETLELIVTLQNPFTFDLELQTLALSTSGVPFEAKSMSVTLPAHSYHAVSIVGKPLETGDLVIRGCIVRAPGGASREFILPLSTDEEGEKLSRKRGAIDCEAGRTKYSGLDSRPWERVRRRASTTLPSDQSFHFLGCKVVPEQPLLRIRRTSLTHGAVMMYDGEMSTIRLTLENVSTLPVDFLRLSFDDSTMAPAQQALADGEMSVFETYETEYDLIHRPAFSWKSKDDFKEIAPGQKVTVAVLCFGKVGCTDGTIHVAYSYVHRPVPDGEEPPEVFHTRQLTYPVLVTVYHMLECHEMDILPFDNVRGLSSDEEEPNSHSCQSLLNVGDEVGWCLFSIDVRNMYGLPFEVTFERDQEGTPKVSTTMVVAPGSMSRIIIPMKKFLLPEEIVSQPIPTLSDRQFVVNKSKLTTTEEKNQRELFWYREELFKFIRGRWREAGGTRSGDLSLRQQRMTLTMLETLRTENAGVKLSIIRYSNNSSEEEIPLSSGKFNPSPNEFVYLRTHVTNLSKIPLVFIVNLDMTPPEHVLFEGVLSNIPLGRLEPGTSQFVETGVGFLCHGCFNIRAEVRILGAPRSGRKAGMGEITAVVREVL